MQKHIRIAKFVTLIAFLVLLFMTYFLRFEVARLNTIRFSAENISSDERMKEMKETYPIRVEEYSAQMKNYEIQRNYYDEMLTLFQNDYDEYVKRQKDRYSPPQLPRKPQKPKSPELSDKFAEINADFREHKYQYFRMANTLNWIACFAALFLVGGLLYLLMFDTEGQRILYLGILIVGFIFMIGPSFHTILSAIVAFLETPRM